MHILFLTDNFPPEVNAPASRTFEHCRNWVRAGHHVTVVTCAPNFPQGKVYPGYRNKLWQTEDMEGIKVVRVWSFITANEGFVRRTLDYLSYMFSAVLASFFVRKPDLVIGTSPQFFTACAAYFVSCTKRVPFVFELRDLWPESIRAVGAMENSFFISCLEKVEMFLYRKAAKIISVTESFRQSLITRGIDGDKIAVVFNGVDSSRFFPMSKDPVLLERYGLAGKYVVGYIGTHGMAHALETILETADKIRKCHGGDTFRFLFLGNGARKKALQRSAEEKGLENVVFIDSVPKEKVTSYWSLLDVTVIHLKNLPLFETVIPSKLFESMGVGIPVLHGVAGESAKIVADGKVGYLFAPENSDDLLEKLLLISRNQGATQQLKKNCFALAEKFDRELMAGIMLNHLCEVSCDSENK